MPLTCIARLAGKTPQAPVCSAAPRNPPRWQRRIANRREFAPDAIDARRIIQRKSND